MEIEHENIESKGSFFVTMNDIRVAEMTYTWAGERIMIIDHTEVAEILKGQGIGVKLVAAAVEKARKEGFKILPLCPFAKSVFDKTPEYTEVRK